MYDPLRLQFQNQSTQAKTRLLIARANAIRSKTAARLAHATRYLTTARIGLERAQSNLEVRYPVAT